MKELSFLMFVIALTVILKIFIDRIFKLNSGRRVFFYIPDSARFNVIWGFIFYAGYGFIIAKSSFLRIGFGIVIVALFLYLAYLYAFKGFLSGHYGMLTGVLGKIAARKLDAQKILDKQLNEPKYSKEKALKMMGLAPFAAQQPELLQKRLQMLKNLQSSMRIKHSYLGTIIQNLKNALDIKQSA